MQKNGFKLQIGLALVLFAAVLGAVFYLFSDKEKTDAPRQQRTDLTYPGLASVPGDAVMVFASQSARSALDIFAEKSAFCKNLFCGTGKQTVAAFVDSLQTPSFKNLECPFVISLHYNKVFDPLVVFSACTDTVLTGKIISLASKLSLQTAVSPSEEGPTLLVSPSQVILSSAVRHIGVGASILDNKGFASLLPALGGKDAIIVSCKLEPKYVNNFLSKELQKTFSFLASYTDYLSFAISRQASGYQVSYNTMGRSNPAYTVGVYDTKGKSSAADVVPSETVFLVSMTTGGISSYISRYRTYLDANTHLKQYPVEAGKWASGLDITEIARADVMIEETINPILLIKTGPKLSEPVLLKDTDINSLREYRPAIVPYAYPGQAEALFGKMFSLPEEEYFFYKDGWIVVGRNKTLDYLLTKGWEPLSKARRDLGLTKTSPVIYCDLLSNSGRLGSYVSEKIAGGIKNSVQGLSGDVVFVGGNDIIIKRYKIESSQAVADPSLVEVPNGPFTVTNSYTGKKNKLSQGGDNSLTLTDDKGKTLWTIAFPGKLCGSAGDVDFYNNKKIQFLVSAGSKLYLIDRLGRFVKGFPVDLGKEVLLGPEVYDFTGAKGYSAMVLHTDNTLGLYDLHGRVRQGWKGIAPPEQILSLPTLVNEDGRRLWKVETKSVLYTYPFNGGEAVKKEKIKRK